MLDEHIGRPGIRWRQSASAAAAVKPNADEAEGFSPGKPLSGTGGNDKAPAGRGDRATLFYFRRHGLAPRFPTSSFDLTLSLSKGRRTMARRECGRGDDEARLFLLSLVGEGGLARSAKTDEGCWKK